MNKFLELNNISKTFETNKKLKVIKNLSYNFKKGKIYSLMGPSGSGKSTLLNLISLIDKPSSGFLKFNNFKINDNNDERDNIRSKKIGIIYQDKNLLSDFTAVENVMMPNLLISNLLFHLEFQLQDLVKFQLQMCDSILHQEKLYCYHYLYHVKITIIVVILTPPQS